MNQGRSAGDGHMAPTLSIGQTSSLLGTQSSLHGTCIHKDDRKYYSFIYRYITSIFTAETTTALVITSKAIVVFIDHLIIFL